MGSGAYRVDLLFDIGGATMTSPHPQLRRQVEIHIDKNDYLTISFIGDIKFAGRWYGTAEVMREKLTSHSSAAGNVEAVLEQIEDGISAYEKEHEHFQVSDNCLGIYIPVNVVRRLIQVRKRNLRQQQKGEL